MTTVKMNRVEKYLLHYGSDEVGWVGQLFDVAQLKVGLESDSHPKSDGSAIRSWQYGLTVPAYAESVNDLIGAGSSLAEQRQHVLQIWIINCPDNADQQLRRQTQDCLVELLAMSRGLGHCQNLYLQDFGWGQVLLVDRCTDGLALPAKQGVGRARKIGGDLALELWRRGVIKSGWCGFTDADAKLPKDYFPRLEQIPDDAAAAVFPHFHQPEGDALQRQLVASYQARLNQYVEGLQWAGSPYAYHSIGSTIACNLDSYCGVRGMPVKAAGEDFYFLNKLVKAGKVISLTGAPIVLSGRRSLRVPFGTGPAIERGMCSGIGSITHYNPISYQLLKVLLASVVEFWSSHRISQSVRHDQSGNQTTADMTEQLCVRLARWLNDELQGSALAVVKQWVEQWAFIDSIQSMLEQSTTVEVFMRRFHCWFDGFRTLKFMHWWRDHGLADIAVSTDGSSEFAMKLEQSST